MAKPRKPFDSRKFLTLVLLFSGVAALMLYTKPKEKGEGLTNHDMPIYMLHLTASNSSGSIILNGITIASHKASKAPTTSKISLTPWLQNGQNRLTLTTTSPGPKPASKKEPSLMAELEEQQPGQKTKISPLLEIKGAGTKTAAFTAENLPKWQWQNGQATLHNPEEIKKAIKRLHQAYKAKDTELIRKIEAPLFQDMHRLTGREGLERRVYRNEIISKGKLEPLRALRITPFANGKVIRVTNADGEAPVRIYYRYGGGGKVILTGKYWSKINGEWHVVR